METKRCTKCDEVKPIEEFSVNSRATGIRNSRCKPCRMAEQRARRADALKANADEFKATRAAQATARRKRLRLEQLADVVRLVAAQLADGRSVEDVAETLLVVDVRVCGDISAGQTPAPLDVQ